MAEQEIMWFPVEQWKALLQYSSGRRNTKYKAHMACMNLEINVLTEITFRTRIEVRVRVNCRNRNCYRTGRQNRSHFY
jgi:hypothetical protein